MREHFIREDLGRLKFLQSVPVSKSDPDFDVESGRQ